jgi:hypothetical protein
LKQSLVWVDEHRRIHCPWAAAADERSFQMRAEDGRTAGARRAAGDRSEGGLELLDARRHGRGEQRGGAVRGVESRHRQHVIRVVGVALRAAAAVNVQIDIAGQHRARAEVVHTGRVGPLSNRHDPAGVDDDLSRVHTVGGNDLLAGENHGADTM